MWTLVFEAVALFAVTFAVAAFFLREKKPAPSSPPMPAEDVPLQPTQSPPAQPFLSLVPGYKVYGDRKHTVRR
jgi:hypothetical protein